MAILRPRYFPPGIACGVLLSVPLLLVSLTGCRLTGFGTHPHPLPRIVSLAVILPTSGADGPLGRAFLRGIELAARQHVKPARGYRLKLVRLNEESVPASRARVVLRGRRIDAVIGPLESAASLLPTIERQGLAAISLDSQLPTAAPRPGGDGATDRPPLVLFPWARTDADAGNAAARLAAAPAPGMAARSVYLADDGSPAGRALADVFAAAFVQRGGTIAGRRSLTAEDPMGVQSAVSAIIVANPDLVFYAGGTASGAVLRRTLSQTGLPLLPLLTTGPIADHPGWPAAVGREAISAYTIGLLPSLDPAGLAHTKRFLSAYRRVFPHQAVSPQAVAGYDAAMDEIEAIKTVIHAGRPVTRRAVASVMLRAGYHGLTGPIAAGTKSEASPDPFVLYRTDLKGTWRYQGPLKW